MFQGGKNCKRDTKFIVRGTAPYMGEHPEKQFVYFRGKAEIHRRGVWAS